MFAQNVRSHAVAERGAPRAPETKGCLFSEPSPPELLPPTSGFKAQLLRKAVRRPTRKQQTLKEWRRGKQARLREAVFKEGLY